MVRCIKNKPTKTYKCANTDEEFIVDY